MTPEGFKRWQSSCGLSNAEAARSLGVLKRQVERWRAGQAPISKAVELACRQLRMEHLLGHGSKAVKTD